MGQIATLLNSHKGFRGFESLPFRHLKNIVKENVVSNQHKYPEFKEWVWKSFSDHKKILNLEDFIIINYNKGRIFHVGTDSQVYGKKTVFATALVAHNRTQGGEIAIHKYKDLMPYPALRPRLIMEAMITLEVSWYLDQILPANGKIRLHIDVNNELQFKSGQYKEELVGMIMGQGYISYRDVKDHDNHPRIVFWKPDSWAAQSVADRVT
jgi:predicted RNase H-related nuclease YkuK (DUF458 family)